MADIEVKLRAGMTRNGIAGKPQDDIVHSITSFALYGFPESHAASFALLAYASAYLKCHYLAAFTCAMLNNQPMGFYSPAILIKDAQRHGLRVLPVDIVQSDWNCSVPSRDRPRALASEGAVLRLGQEAGQAILRARAERPFNSVDDLALRVREMRRDELNRLAEIGALNSLGAAHGNNAHRRDALWQTQRAILPVGPLLAGEEEIGQPSPLAPMNIGERLFADYHGTGLTIGKHPMAYRRAEMDQLRVTRAADLARVPNGRIVRIAGSVIVRQRPGTAKGFVFLSMEDETGIMNAILTPPTFDRFKLAVLGERFLLIDGVLQNLDGVISVKAARVQSLPQGAAPASHDFY
jgi:error-prone DNA polymerase